MPPRTRRETPARRATRIRKHIEQARDYWSKWPAHLADGDLCQAGEKGWGAVAQLTKAVATLRGWEHYDHVAIQEALTQLSDELPDQMTEIARGLSAGERLHGNFYEVYMTPALTEFALSEVGPLLEILWELLPGEYTGGVSFAEWVEADSTP